MAKDPGDTIFALSSGAIPSGIAVIRISGRESRFAYETICARKAIAGRIARVSFRDGSGGLIDRGLAMFFTGPRSFTGEDCAEFHLHGSRAVVARMLEELGGRDGFRQAEAGEFTLRAYLNGKIDLTMAEALSDLISADTETQRRFALENASGRHRDTYEAWRGRIIELQAMVEATVDFSDEGDVGGHLPEGIWKAACELADEIDDHVGRYRAGEIVREGLRVAIMGAPNAGKSSLLNRLAGREAAIVTEVPGTTRDVIEVDLDLGGMKVRLFDTAGLRPTVDRVEAMGVERALAVAKKADVILELVDLCAPQEIDRPMTDATVLRIGNKIDLMGSGPRDDFDLVISAGRGDGIDRLLERIAGIAHEFGSCTGLIPFRERHVALLRKASEALRRAADSEGNGVELRAEELRLAGDRIGRITGRVDVEDLLEVIFSRFCIGK